MLLCSEQDKHTRNLPKPRKARHQFLKTIKVSCGNQSHQLASLSRSRAAKGRKLSSDSPLQVPSSYRLYPIQLPNYLATLSVVLHSSLLFPPLTCTCFQPQYHPHSTRLLTLYNAVKRRHSRSSLLSFVYRLRFLRFCPLSLLA